MLFFTSPKESNRRHQKTFKSFEGHGSTYNQKFFGKLLNISLAGRGCAKKVGYLLEN